MQAGIEAILRLGYSSCPSRSFVLWLCLVPSIAARMCAYPLGMAETAVSVVDRIPVTRRRTEEGFVRGKAGLTRTGIFLYSDIELGVGDTGKTVRVMRTPETVFHSDTIASLAGAPITLNHPARQRKADELERPRCRQRRWYPAAGGRPS